MSDCPMLISNKLHSFRNFTGTNIRKGDGIRIAPYAKCPKPQNTAQSGSERTGSQTKSADRILLLN